jgi:hypothetical protein
MNRRKFLRDAGAAPVESHANLTHAGALHVPPYTAVLLEA